MIRIKHFLDTVEESDGERLWIEPIGLTKDLQELCKVGYVFPHLGPPIRLWKWFENHRDGFEEFRARYHAHLQKSRYLPALESLAAAGLQHDVTLVHHGDHPEENTASALLDFLTELQAHVRPE